MKNQECKTRPKIVIVNSNELVFFSDSARINKCSGSCNNINDPYAKICIVNVIKDADIKVFNLILRTNGTSHIKFPENYESKCRFKCL